MDGGYKCICIIYATERVERFAYLSICTIGIGRGFAKVTGKELEFCEKERSWGNELVKMYVVGVQVVYRQ